MGHGDLVGKCNLYAFDAKKQQAYHHASNLYRLLRPLKICFCCTMCFILGGGFEFRFCCIMCLTEQLQAALGMAFQRLEFVKSLQVCFESICYMDIVLIHHISSDCF